MPDMFTGPDLQCYNDLSALQRALITEVAADETHQAIIDKTSNQKIKEWLTEIMQDEQNHQGKLLALIAELRGGDESTYVKKLDEGMRGEG